MNGLSQKWISNFEEKTSLHNVITKRLVKAPSYNLLINKTNTNTDTYIKIQSKKILLIKRFKKEKNFVHFKSRTDSHISNYSNQTK